MHGRLLRRSLVFLLAPFMTAARQEATPTHNRPAVSAPALLTHPSPVFMAVTPSFATPPGRPAVSAPALLTHPSPVFMAVTTSFATPPGFMGPLAIPRTVHYGPGTRQNKRRRLLRRGGGW